jgi:hypothetical protein
MSRNTSGVSPATPTRWGQIKREPPPPRYSRWGHIKGEQWGHFRVLRPRRAIVTNNLRDYRPLHADAITPGGPGHFGMVFMPGSYRRTKADTGRIISALEAKLAEYPGDGDLANGECWL